MSDRMNRIYRMNKDEASHSKPLLRHSSFVLILSIPFILSNNRWLTILLWYLRRTVSCHIPGGDLRSTGLCDGLRLCLTLCGDSIYSGDKEYPCVLLSMAL